MSTNDAQKIKQNKKLLATRIRTKLDEMMGDVNGNIRTYEQLKSELEGTRSLPGQIRRKVTISKRESYYISPITRIEGIISDIKDFVGQLERLDSGSKEYLVGPIRNVITSLEAILMRKRNHEASRELLTDAEITNMLEDLTRVKRNITTLVNSVDSYIRNLG